MILPRKRILLPIAALLVAATGCQVFFPFVPDRITRLFLDGALGAVGAGNFAAIQVDPGSEDSAGPAFVAAGDIDGDGLNDLATAWNESQPLQLHFQRRTAAGDVTFETITLAGDFPITIVSGLGIADLDGDGSNDIVVLIKETGVFARCRLTGETLSGESDPAGLILIFFAPADLADSTNALAWEQVMLSQSETAGASPSDPQIPDEGGFTSMALGDIDGVNGTDIVVAWNANSCEGGGNRVEYYTNPGPGTARQSNAWASNPVESDAPPVKWVGIADIDRDGDNDIISTFPSARGQNLRWSRNPTLDVPDSFHVSDGLWQRGAIGRLAPGADVFDVGDIDNDGIIDVALRSTAGRVIVWYKGPVNPTTAPVRNISWQVFTLAEFNDRTPQAVALADIDGDGQLELAVSADGAILLLDPFSDDGVYNQWEEFLIIDDRGTANPAVTDPFVDPNEISADNTVINQLAVVDLDGDGAMDIVATLDRRDQSGVSNDAVIWFRNTQP